jgi:FkbM family methyltransferase
LNRASAARHTVRSIARYRNWPEVVRALLAGAPIRELHTRSGHTVVAPADSTCLQLMQEIWFRRLYNPPGFEIRPGDTVVDIGGNIGLFAVHAALAGASCVLAVEPFPENARYIERNAELNGVAGTIRVVEAAVTDHANGADLFLAEISGGHLLFPESSSGPRTTSIRVATTTLPALLGAHGIDRVDFLKLDCEGAEGSILRSTPDDVLGRVGRIAMEYHDNVSAMSHDRIAEWLTARGFEVRATSRRRSPFGYLYARRPVY